MKLLIVDDEALARLRLRGLIESLPGAGWGRIELTEAADAAQALRAVRQDSYDALLLDIHMPGLSGLQLASELQQLRDAPAVIFVTAHAEHALQAFELEALDYLTKPVRRERLQAALQRVQQRIGPPVRADAAPPDAALVVSDRGRTLRLPLNEVLYLKAEQKLVVLRTPGGSHVLDESLTDLERRLHDLGGDFLRVHRNALVARAAIRELELHSDEGDGWAVRVAPLDEWLAVSRRQVAAVRAALEARAS